jgi:O-acetyl-ADP-ribose deacetylase (regulator of RNase III)
MLKQPVCFVIMPYGKRVVEDLEIDFDALFDDFIRPAGEAAHFDVVRSDRELASGVIMPRLFSAIYSADLVVADITYQNPNVYYELGVRHALRARGTLLIRRIGGDLGVRPLNAPASGGVADTAFDIKGITIWSYEATRSGLQVAIDELRRRIERVASAVDIDSPAFLYLEGLKVVTGSPRAHARDDATYEILSDAGEPLGHYVGYRSGDLKELKNERAVDFWVNSENVLMQMARIYERSVSSTIRYLGAFQPDPHAPSFDDTIAVDLAAKLGSRHAVNPGEVVVTTGGRLRETHGVKAILHAAVVTGTPGRGYEAISDDLLIETARTVFAVARTLIQSGNSETAGQSLIMPLFGTGQGRLDPNRNAERLLLEAIQDLSYHAVNSDPEKPGLKAVLFSTFTKEHVTLLYRMLEALAAKGALRRVTAAGEWKHATVAAGS